jgi:hypothetical protein
MIHGGGLLFVDLAAHSGTDRFGGKISRCGMQPSAEHWMIDETSRVLRQREENGLRYILGTVRLAGHPMGG